MEVLIVLIVLGLLATVFVVPIIALVSARAAKHEVRQVRQEVEALRMRMSALTAQLAQVRSVTAEPARPAAAPEVAAPVAPSPEPPLQAPPVSPVLEASPEVPGASPVEAEPPPTAAEPPPAARAPEPTTAPPSFDWEKWLGVRGAAVLGGVVFALAGLMFFRYSIERGWLSPTVRVSLGTLAGLVSLVISERLRGRYAVTSNAFAGGAVVVLYASFWAAKAMYGLVPMELSFALMALTTVVACLLSVRHRSMVIAVLGLVGGFATPLLLSAGSNRPIGLFGYILLLDVGFLYIAFKRRWSVIALMALVGTLILQVGWVGARMEPDQLFIALGILGVFALLFIAAARRASTELSPAGRRLWLVTQGSALLLPYAFALYFASQATFGTHLYPVALLLALLAAAASWVSRGSALTTPWLVIAAAAAELAVVGAYVSQVPLTTALTWELVACCVALSGVFHFFSEWRRPEASRSQDTAAAMAHLGFFWILAAVAMKPLEPWPFVVAWICLGLLGLRLSTLARVPVYQLLVGVGLAVAFGAYRHVGFSAAEVPAGLAQPLVAFGLELLVAIGLFLWARTRGDALERTWADRTTVLFCGIALLTSAALPIVSPFSPIEPMLAALLLAAVGVAAATRLREGPLLLGTVVAVSLTLSAWAAHAAALDKALAVSFVLTLVSALVWPAWTLAAGRRFASDRFSVYAAALSAPLHFWALQHLYRDAFGADTIGVLPVALGGLALVGLWSARRSWSDAAARNRGTVWFAAVALGFISVAIPLQLEKQWITVGWAALGLSTTVLWRKLDHEGLKWFALLLLTAVTVRLILNPAVLDYSQRGALPVLNWMMYTYLVSALCLGLVSWLLGPLEVARARGWEKPIYASGVAVGAANTGIGCILVVFAWLNLAVFDFFAEGARFIISFERLPARDLTLSIVWICYAVVLLAIGMWRRSRALRWTSLIFMLVSIGKVFLYDLGQLKDLYRVMSLLGLAVSLLLISLAYQRFVFRKEGAPT